MSLVAHYKLDGNAEDSVGGNHGYSVGTDFFYDSGKIGQSLAVNYTTGQSGIRAVNTNLPLGSSSRVVTLWFKTSNPGSGYPVIFSYGILTLGNGFFIGYNSSTQKIYVDSFNGLAAGFIGVPYFNNQWHFLMVTYSEGYLSIYCDWALKDSVNQPINTINTTNLCGIGVRNDNVSYFFKGNIDDVRIYDSLLSDQEWREVNKLSKILHYNFNTLKESTTNVVLNTNLDTGWDKGYNTGIEWNTKSPPMGVQSPVVSFYDADTNLNGYWYSYGNYAPQIPNTIYTVSLYVATRDSNFRIGFYTADNSEVGRHFGEYITVPNDENWHRLIWNSFLNPSDSQSESLSFHFYFGNAQGEEQRTWLCAPQMEAKDHATPFVIGSRVDIIKDISGQNYDSILTLVETPRWIPTTKIGSGSYNFNGNNSYMEISKPLSIFNSSFTIAMWCYFLDDSRGILLGDFQRLNTQNINFEKHNNRTLRLYWNASPDIFTGSNVFELNTWQHVAVVRDKENSFVYFYVQGNLVYTYSGALTDKTTTGLHLIGRDNRTGITTTYGYINDTQIYASALSQTDLKELISIRMSIDNTGKNNIVELIEDTSLFDYDIQKYNLLENGTHQYASNYNFPNFTYNSTLKCLSTATYYANYQSSNFIPIIGNGFDNFDQYKIEGEFKGVDVATRYYFGIDCFDKNYRRIYHYDVAYYAGTATTLTVDLVAGNTTMTVASTTNWSTPGSTSTRFIALWHPSDDPLYVPYRYTFRIISYTSYTGNVLTLTSAYSGTTIPAGSKVQNHYSGGTYSYIAASNSLTSLTQWEYKTGTTLATDNVASMRYATSYIRALFLLNRDFSGGTTLVRNLRLHNITRNQTIPLELNPIKPKLKSTGIYESFSISEVGIVDDYLKAYYPFNDNTFDYSGNNNHGTSDGVTITNGIDQLCYYFDGTGTPDGVTPGANIIIPEAVTSTNNYPNGCTYSFWINVDTDAVDRMGLLFGAGTIRHIEINSISKTFRTEAALENGYSFGSGNFPYNVRGQWSHFAIVFANSELNRPVRWYQNGDLFYTGNMTGGAYPETEYFSFNRIGRSTGSGAYIYAPSLKGKMQDFRIYSKILTTSEIKTLNDLTNPESKIKTKIDTNIIYSKEFYEVL